MEPWLSLVGSVGFPIVVTLYLLLRLENTLKELTRAVWELKAAFDRHVGQEPPPALAPPGNDIFSTG